MSLPFEFTVDGPALSQRADSKSLRRWKARVENAATLRWHGQSPVAGKIMVTITCFDYDRPFDLDNIVKPILDAMSKLIYDDDKQITDLHCHKRVLGTELEARNPSPILSAALDRSIQFVHIVVADAPDQGVTP